MNRLIVLMLCLASAGGIAAYTYWAGGGAPAPRGGAGAAEEIDGTPVYTVPHRTAEPAAEPPAGPPPPTVAARTIDPGDRVGLARALQRELKRVGCYDGEVTGTWTASSRTAMKAFTERVNAALPIDSPDHVLLSLVQSHQGRACDTECPAGRTAAKGGACVPDAALAKAWEPSVAADGAAEGASGKESAAAAGAAAAALAAGRRDSKAADGAAKPGPRKAPAPERKAVADRGAAHGGPVPPEGMRERRGRRTDSNEPRPPKVVRDVLKVLGFN